MWGTGQEDSLSLVILRNLWNHVPCVSPVQKKMKTQEDRTPTHDIFADRLL